MEISTSNEKQAELDKYIVLVLATLDYYLDPSNPQSISKIGLTDYYKGLKIQADEQYKKGRLTKLKQWFRDLTEMFIETNDLKFNDYLRKKTNYDEDIFKSFNNRLDKIIEKGKISNDNQFYDIRNAVDQLCQLEPSDLNTINILNKLLLDYEERKAKTKVKNQLGKDL